MLRLAALAACAALAPAAVAADPKKPNVVYIMADDKDYNHPVWERHTRTIPLKSFKS